MKVDFLFSYSGASFEELSGMLDSLKNFQKMFSDKKDLLKIQANRFENVLKHKIMEKEAMEVRFLHYTYPNIFSCKV